MEQKGTTKLFSDSANVLILRYCGVTFRPAAVETVPLKLVVRTDIEACSIIGAHESTRV